MKSSLKTWLLVLLALMLVGLIGFLLLWQPEKTTAPANAGKPNEITLPKGGDFTLEGPDGPVSLHDYKGKVVVLYFGYTYCPDVCPTSLALIGDALSRLTADELARVQTIFISLDPERDKPDRLRSYAPFFHPNVIGVTGNPQTIAELANRYGVKYRRYTPQDADENQYVIDHTSITYLVAPDGRLAESLAHGADSQTIADRIRALLHTS